MRGHAAWALGEIGGGRRRSGEAAEAEEDPWCKDEIRLALADGTVKRNLG